MVKRPMVRQFLEDAFCGESKAHMKYSIFAEKAEKEGLHNLAKMYRAIAYAEFVHAKNHFIALGHLSDITENLKSSIEGETFEVDNMYPVYLNASEFEKEKEAERSNHFALEAEKGHIVMYKDALEKAEKNQDVKSDTFYVCPICGYTTDEPVQDKCPVCGAKKEFFVKF